MKIYIQWKIWTLLNNNSVFRTLMHFFFTLIHFLLFRLFFFFLVQKTICKIVHFDGHTIESRKGWLNSSEIKSLLSFYAFTQPGIEKMLIGQRNTIPQPSGKLVIHARILVIACLEYLILEVTTKLI